MSNHKLVQKTLKITAVGAIAFSVLAQPLSLVASAAETTSINKVERKLLTATTQSVELLKNNKLIGAPVSEITTKQFMPQWQMALTKDLKTENISAIGQDTELTYQQQGSFGPSFSYGSLNSTYRMTAYNSYGSDRWTINNNLERIAIYQDVPTVIGQTYKLKIVARNYPSAYASDINKTNQLAYISSDGLNQEATFIATTTTTRISLILGGRSSILQESINPTTVSLVAVIDTDKLKSDIDALFVNNTPTSNAIKTTTDQAAIDALQKQIDTLEASTTKTALQNELNLAQELLDARNAEKQHETDATAAINNLFIDNNPANHIKDTTNQAAIDAAQAKVDAVTDAAKKAEMQTQVDKAQAELDAKNAEKKRETEAKTSVDNLFIDNNSANHIKDTTNQAAIDAAQVKVNAVTDTAAKAELQTKVDKAQSELNARTAEAQREAEAKTSVNNLFIDNNPANHIKDTTNQAIIDAAQTKVNAVTDVTVKAELQAQVDKAQAELNAKNAEKQRENEAKAVVNDLFIGNDPANNIKETTTQAAIDAAQAKVDAITDPTVKAELQKEIDKAQSQLDGAVDIVGVAAKYTVGDLYITGTYTGPATGLSLDVNGKRYYGGEIKDGKFKFYGLDKALKVGDVVKLNLYNVNKEIKQTINIQVVEPLKVTVADYKIGDSNINATFNNSDITKVGVVVDGKKYWGGDVADGKVKFYALDKIKSASSVVTMNFYDADNNLLATKQVKLLASYAGEVTTANYKVGENNITGAFTGDVKQVAISINGTKYYGGTVTAATSTYKFYALDKKIKATDTVIVYGYDPEGKQLSQKTVTITE
ncbi:immunoglobulin-like domain-containing protein [Listeria booriae]|uniref:immunoglobulin-like domain-containing protein n=1 Tax=Listeria booriae TaxID=1552123 RepID=UPI0016295FD1|nr:immunoglobulin-like domain-containing protein [Listeria booriae]MBC2390573.1 hypothetical protein [Listeria booriae]